jgi:hypothetical protein
MCGPALAAFTVAVVASCAVGPGAISSDAPTRTASAAREMTLPPNKQADEDRRLAALAAASADAAARGITKADDPGPPTPGPSEADIILDPHFNAGAGMVIQSTDPAPGVDAVITGYWFEDRGNSHFVSVFAGRDAKNQSQGVVLVTFGLPDVLRFNAPGAHGRLEIVGAVGEVLDLRAADGAALRFDVTALKFE